VSLFIFLAFRVFGASWLFLRVDLAFFAHDTWQPWSRKGPEMLTVSLGRTLVKDKVIFHKIQWFLNKP